MSIEKAFESIDSELETLRSLIVKLDRAIRAAAKSSADGNLATVKRNAESGEALLDEIASQMRVAKDAIERAQSRLNQGPEELRREVGELVVAAGAPWLPTENRFAFVSFPVMVRFQSDRVRVDRKLVRSQRPKAIAAAVAATVKRTRGTLPSDAGGTTERERVLGERVLRLIWKAARIAAGHIDTPVSDLLVGKGQKETGRAGKAPQPVHGGRLTVPARQIFEVLNLNNPDYTEAEFTWHLYLLDRTRITETDGFRLSFSASTGTRSGRHFRILDENGYEHVYFAISFERVERTESTGSP